MSIVTDSPFVNTEHVERSPEVAALERALNSGAGAFELVWAAHVALFIVTQNQIEQQAYEMQEKLKEIEWLQKLQRAINAGKSSTVESLLSDDAAISNIQRGEGKKTKDGKIIYEEWHLGDDYTMRIYHADDTDTKYVNEKTGQIWAADGITGEVPDGPGQPGSVSWDEWNEQEGYDPAKHGTVYNYNSQNSNGGIPGEDIRLHVQIVDKDGNVVLGFFDFDEKSTHVNGANFYVPIYGEAADENGETPVEIKGWETQENISGNDNYEIILNGDISVFFDLKGGDLNYLSVIDRSQDVGAQLNLNKFKYGGAVQNSEKEDLMKNSYDIEEEYFNRRAQTERRYVPSYNNFSTDNELVSRATINSVEYHGMTEDQKLEADTDLVMRILFPQYYGGDGSPFGIGSAAGQMAGMRHIVKGYIESGDIIIARDYGGNSNSVEIKVDAQSEGGIWFLNTLKGKEGAELSNAPHTFADINGEQYITSHHNSDSYHQGSYFLKSNPQQDVPFNKQDYDDDRMSTFDEAMDNLPPEFFTILHGEQNRNHNSEMTSEEFHNKYPDFASHQRLYMDGHGELDGVGENYRYYSVHEYTGDYLSASGGSSVAWSPEGSQGQRLPGQREVQDSEAFQESEARFAELGFQDTDNDGMLYDDFVQYAQEELGLPHTDFMGQIDKDTRKKTSDAIDARVGQLTSINQIDMMFLQKSINILNFIVSALSNIESGKNRALQTVANNFS